MVFHVEPVSESGEAKPGSILSQTLLQNPEVKAVRFHFAAGQELSEHTATMGALIGQISGHAHWTLGDASLEAKPGDWAFMPPHLKHSIQATEESVILLYLLKNSGAKE